MRYMFIEYTYFTFPVPPTRDTSSYLYICLHSHLIPSLTCPGSLPCTQLPTIEGATIVYVTSTNDPDGQVMYRCDAGKVFPYGGPKLLTHCRDVLPMFPNYTCKWEGRHLTCFNSLYYIL